MTFTGLDYLRLGVYGLVGRGRLMEIGIAGILSAFAHIGRGRELDIYA